MLLCGLQTFLSDADSLASPPKIHLSLVPRVPAEPGTNEPLQVVGTDTLTSHSYFHLLTSDLCFQTSPGLPTEQSVACTGAAQNLLTFPEPSFMDRLNAVEEELDCSPAYTYHQVNLPTCHPATHLPYNHVSASDSRLSGRHRLSVVRKAVWLTGRAPNSGWLTFLWVSWRPSCWRLTSLQTCMIKVAPSRRRIATGQSGCRGLWPLTTKVCSYTSHRSSTVFTCMQI